MESNFDTEKTPLAPPIRIRKKPGRKPNPASPALRKAQNRAAQRAFRERKETYIKELETSNKNLQEQRDKFRKESQELKVEVEIMRSENWYLKGIVLTLHLLCYKHHLVIPQHGPFFSDQVLSVLAQSIPESISTYMDLNGINKIPKPEKLSGLKNHIKPGNSVLSSSFTLAVTKDGIQPLPESIGYKPDMSSIIHNETTESLKNMCDTSPSVSDSVYHSLELESPSPPPLSSAPDNLNPDNNTLPRPVMLTNEPLTTNLAAIQALRLRLRLQTIRSRTDTRSFVIRPTLLQLTVPHDPRIDLLPTPHMRDRMIIYRDRFDLDDCFRCLIEKSKFHGGDPAIAANWELPPEFYEKYWFLTIDYDLRRITNKWRTLQGLNKLKDQPTAEPVGSENVQPELEPPTPDLNLNDEISSLLETELMKFTQQPQQNHPVLDDTFIPQFQPQKLSSSGTSKISINSIEPVLLTDATKLPSIESTVETHKPPRYHPYHYNGRSNGRTSETHPHWDTFIQSEKDYDMLIDHIIHADKTF